MNDAWLFAAVAAFAVLLAVGAATLLRLIALSRQRESASRDAAEMRGRLE
jgi:hypothetical protein